MMVPNTLWTIRSEPSMFKIHFVVAIAASLTACATPVSYTHLDVYKRQVERFALDFEHRFLMRWVEHELMAIVSAIMPGDLE